MSKSTCTRKVRVTSFHINSETVKTLQQIFESENNRVYFVNGVTGSGKTVNSAWACCRTKREIYFLEPINSPIMSLKTFCNSKIPPGENWKKVDSKFWSDSKKFSIRKSNVLEITNYNSFFIRLKNSVKKEKNSIIFLDEVHESSPFVDLVFLMVLDLMETHPNLKLIVSSACSLPRRFASALNNLGLMTVRLIPSLKKIQRKIRDVFVLDECKNILKKISKNEMDYSIELNQAVSDMEEMFHEFFGEVSIVEKEKMRKRTVINSIKKQGWLVFSKFIFWYVMSTKQHTIVFLPGIAEVKTIKKIIQEEQKNSQCYDVTIMEVHSKSKLVNEETNDPKNEKIKLVLATNAMESGKTIPGIGVVIDTCLEKVIHKNNFLEMKELALTVITDNSRLQRRGRTGRTCSGSYIHFVKEEQNLLPFKRCPLYYIDFKEISDFCGIEEVEKVLSKKTKYFHFNQMELSVYKEREREGCYDNCTLQRKKTKYDEALQFWMERSEMKQVLENLTYEDVTKIYNARKLNKGKYKIENGFFFGGKLSNGCKFLNNSFIQFIQGYLNVSSLLIGEIKAKDSSKQEHLLLFQKNKKDKYFFDECFLSDTKVKKLKNLINISKKDVCFDLEKLLEYETEGNFLTKCSKIVHEVSLKSEPIKSVECSFTGLLRGDWDVQYFDGFNPKCFFGKIGTTFGIGCNSIIQKVNGRHYMDCFLLEKKILYIVLLSRGNLLCNKLYLSFAPFFSIITFNREVKRSVFNICKNLNCFIRNGNKMKTRMWFDKAIECDFSDLQILNVCTRNYKEFHTIFPRSSQVVLEWDSVAPVLFRSFYVDPEKYQYFWNSLHFVNLIIVNFEKDNLEQILLEETKYYFQREKFFQECFWLISFLREILREKLKNEECFRETGNFLKAFKGVKPKKLFKDIIRLFKDFHQEFAASFKYLKKEPCQEKK